MIELSDNGNFRLLGFVELDFKRAALPAGNSGGIQRQSGEALGFYPGLSLAAAR